MIRVAGDLRLIDLPPLKHSIRTVISQSLLKKIDGGRIAAHAIMIGTPAIRNLNLSREDKVASSNS